MSKQSAGILVTWENSQGKHYMLCKRADGHGVVYGGLWSVPGGSVEPGETAKEGAVREFLEETQIQLPIDKVELIEVDDSKNNTDYHLFLYESPEYFSPTLDFEHTSWGWFKSNEVPDNDENGDTVPQIKHLTKYDNRL